jgi:hypothetical protein
MLFKCVDCNKMISVSSTGRGDRNDLALFMNSVFGEQFATRWATCSACGHTYCDKCAAKRGNLFAGAKCTCGGEISEKYNFRSNE